MFWRRTTPPITEAERRNGLRLRLFRARLWENPVVYFSDDSMMALAERIGVFKDLRKPCCVKRPFDIFELDQIITRAHDAHIDAIFSAADRWGGDF